MDAVATVRRVMESIETGVYGRPGRAEWLGSNASASPQEGVFAAVRARGYVSGAPAAELAGQLFKAIEEICELGSLVTRDPAFATMGHEMRRRFDDAGSWPAARVDGLNVDAVVEELADSVVPLLVAAQLVTMMAGRQVDLVGEAARKAVRDVGRGRRKVQSAEYKVQSDHESAK